MLKSLLRRVVIYVVTILLFSLLFLYVGWESKDWKDLKEEEDKGMLDKYLNRVYFATMTFASADGIIKPKTKELKLTVLLMVFVVIIEAFTLIFQTKWHSVKRK